MSQRIAVAAIPLRGQPAKPPPPHRGANGQTRPARTTSRARFKFFRAFLREPLRVGSFWPSSPELGPGTGAFTSLILERLKRKSQFFAL